MVRGNGLTFQYLLEGVQFHFLGRFGQIKIIDLGGIADRRQLAQPNEPFAEIGKHGHKHDEVVTHLALRDAQV